MTNSTSGTSSTSSTSSSLAQFSGVASGLDTKALIDAMLQPETARVTRLTNNISSLASQRQAYTDLQTSLNDLLSKVQAFTMLKSGSARTATSADTAKFTAVATTAAIPGQYSIVVDHLATATVATSTAAVGTPVTDPSQLLSSLPFAGSVKGGALTLVVDGQLTTATIGDPTTTTLQSAMDAIATAVNGKLGGDGTATVSVSGNRLQIAVSGNAGQHTLLLGATGDTSNLFGLAGLTGQSATISAGGGTLQGATSLGVVRTTAALDSAGLSGLASTTTGKMTINGVDISYDTTTDTLSGILTKINNSTAGVIASIDRTNDRVILRSKTEGAQPIVLADTGTLLGALNLAPGTTNAQAIGSNALIHVDGRPVTSTTNQVTGAIDNVTINVAGETTTAVTLTVGVDTSKIESALTDLVKSYNTVADKLDDATANDPKQTQGTLTDDLSVRSLLSTIRQQILAPLPTATGTIRSLADVGVSTGKIGSSIGTTSRLVLDTDKLHKALADDPGGAATLLGPGGALDSTVSTLKSWTDYGGILFTRKQSIDDETRSLASELIDAQDRVDQRRTTLEAKYAQMESTLAGLQQTLSQLNSQNAASNK